MSSELKAAAQRQKAKGLKRLRWYCQMCEKQCSDENSFQCHQASASHLRRMSQFRADPEQYMEQFSKQFEAEFTEILRRRSLNSYVDANSIYQDLIADKQHIHMNATKWDSLSSFVQYLGKHAIADVERDEDSNKWLVKYSKPYTSSGRAFSTVESVTTAMSESERDEQQTRRRLNAMKQLQHSAESKEDKPVAPTEFQRDSEHGSHRLAVNLSSRPAAFKQPQLASNAVFDQQQTNNVASSASSKSASKAQSMLASLATEHESQKRQHTADHVSHSNVKKHKLDAVSSVSYYPNIIIKCLNQALESGLYHKKKGRVLAVNADSHTIEVEMLDSGDVLQLDWLDLETVIPNIGKRVMILAGRHSGEVATVKQLDMDRLTCDVQLEQSNEAVSGLSLDHVSKFDDSRKS